MNNVAYPSFTGFAGDNNIRFPLSRAEEILSEEGFEPTGVLVVVRGTDKGEECTRWVVSGPAFRTNAQVVGELEFMKLKYMIND